MLWQCMLSHCIICCLHPTRNKNLHELRSSIWVADEHILFSWKDTSSNVLTVSIEDKLVNEPKAKFTWLKQNMWLLHGEVRFSKLIIVFEFHLMFDSDWFRTHGGHPLPWQQSGFRDWFCCPIPKHATSSYSPPSLQFHAWDHWVKMERLSCFRCHPSVPQVWEWLFPASQPLPSPTRITSSGNGDA